MRLSDGAELASRTQLGPSGSPHVVLLHGGPGLWDYLQPLGALIEGAATVHRYDQRGCGRSSASSEQSLTRSVADLEELRQHWDADRLIVLGHSFGAALALAYAAHHPERTAAVVYLAGTGLGDWRTPSRAEEARRRAPWASRFAELSASEPRSWEEEVEWRRIQWASDYADPVAGHELCRTMAETPLPVNRHANRALTVTDDDLVGWAAAVRCSVTFVHGSADPRPVAPVVALADRVGTARKRIIQGAGHLPWVERPDETAELLHEVLSTVPAAGSTGRPTD